MCCPAQIPTEVPAQYLCACEAFSIDMYDGIKAVTAPFAGKEQVANAVNTHLTVFYRFKESLCSEAVPPLGCVRRATIQVQTDL